jgi:hypothetical protein
VSLYVNGTRLKAVTLPATPDWDTWGDASETVKLQAGTNAVRIAYDPADTANVNLDRITVIPLSGTLPDVRPNLVDNGSFEAGTAGWSESHTVGPLSFGVDAGDALAMKRRWCSGSTRRLGRLDGRG